jgi:hypothetical protein
MYLPSAEFVRQREIEAHRKRAPAPAAGPRAGGGSRIIVAHNNVVIGARVRLQISDRFQGYDRGCVDTPLAMTATASKESPILAF